MGRNRGGHWGEREIILYNYFEFDGKDISLRSKKRF